MARKFGNLSAEDAIKQTPYRSGTAIEGGFRSALANLRAGALADEITRAQQAAYENHGPSVYVDNPKDDIDTSGQPVEVGPEAFTNSYVQMLEAERQRQQAFAEGVAPRVRRLEDSRSLGDLANYVGGVVGAVPVTMAPVMGAAIAGRVGGKLLTPAVRRVSPTVASALPTVGSGAAAYATSYDMLVGENLNAQLNDPIAAAQPAAYRRRNARLAAAGGAVLDAVLPVGLVGAARKLGMSGDKAATGILAGYGLEGVTETAQLGLQNMQLRDLGGVTMQDSGLDYLNAGVAGAIGGGAMSGAAAGVGYAANKFAKPEAPVDQALAQEIDAAQQPVVDRDSAMSDAELATEWERAQPGYVGSDSVVDMTGLTPEQQQQYMQDVMESDSIADVDGEIEIAQQLRRDAEAAGDANQVAMAQQRIDHLERQKIADADWKAKWEAAQPGYAGDVKNPELGMAPPTVITDTDVDNVDARADAAYQQASDVRRREYEELVGAAASDTAEKSDTVGVDDPVLSALQEELTFADAEGRFNDVVDIQERIDAHQARRAAKNESEVEVPEFSEKSFPLGSRKGEERGNLSHANVYAGRNDDDGTTHVEISRAKDGSVARIRMIDADIGAVSELSPRDYPKDATDAMILKAGFEGSVFVDGYEQLDTSKGRPDWEGIAKAHDEMLDAREAAQREATEERSTIEEVDPTAVADEAAQVLTGSVEPDTERLASDPIGYEQEQTVREQRAAQTMLAELKQGSLKGGTTPAIRARVKQLETAEQLDDASVAEIVSLYNQAVQPTKLADTVQRLKEGGTVADSQVKGDEKHSFADAKLSRNTAPLRREIEVELISSGLLTDPKQAREVAKNIMLLDTLSAQSDKEINAVQYAAMIEGREVIKKFDQSGKIAKTLAAARELEAQRLAAGKQSAASGIASAVRDTESAVNPDLFNRYPALADMDSRLSEGRWEESVMMRIMPAEARSRMLGINDNAPDNVKRDGVARPILHVATWIDTANDPAISEAQREEARGKLLSFYKDKARVDLVLSAYKDLRSAATKTDPRQIDDERSILAEEMAGNETVAPLNNEDYKLAEERELDGAWLDNDRLDAQKDLRPVEYAGSGKYGAPFSSKAATRETAEDREWVGLADHLERNDPNVDPKIALRDAVRSVRSEMTEVLGASIKDKWNSAAVKQIRNGLGLPTNAKHQDGDNLVRVTEAMRVKYAAAREDLARVEEARAEMEFTKVDPEATESEKLIAQEEYQTLRREAVQTHGREFLVNTHQGRVVWGPGKYSDTLGPQIEEMSSYPAWVYRDEDMASLEGASADMVRSALNELKVNVAKNEDGGINLSRQEVMKIAESKGNIRLEEVDAKRGHRMVSFKDERTGKDLVLDVRRLADLMLSKLSKNGALSPKQQGWSQHRAEALLQALGSLQMIPGFENIFKGEEGKQLHDRIAGMVLSEKNPKYFPDAKNITVGSLLKTKGGNFQRKSESDIRADVHAEIESGVIKDPLRLGHDILLEAEVQKRLGQQRLIARSHTEAVAWAQREVDDAVSKGRFKHLEGKDQEAAIKAEVDKLTKIFNQQSMEASRPTLDEAEGAFTAYEEDRAAGPRNHAEEGRLAAQKGYFNGHKRIAPEDAVQEVKGEEDLRHEEREKERREIASGKKPNRDLTDTPITYTDKVLPYYRAAVDPTARFEYRPTVEEATKTLEAKPEAKSEKKTTARKPAINARQKAFIDQTNEGLLTGQVIEDPVALVENLVDVFTQLAQNGHLDGNRTSAAKKAANVWVEVLDPKSVFHIGRRALAAGVITTTQYEAILEKTGHAVDKHEGHTFVGKSTPGFADDFKKAMKMMSKDKTMSEQELYTQTGWFRDARGEWRKDINTVGEYTSLGANLMQMEMKGETTRNLGAMLNGQGAGRALRTHMNKVTVSMPSTWSLDTPNIFDEAAGVIHVNPVRQILHAARRDQMFKLGDKVISYRELKLLFGKENSKGELVLASKNEVSKRFAEKFPDTAGALETALNDAAAASVLEGVQRIVQQLSYAEQQVNNWTGAAIDYLGGDKEAQKLAAKIADPKATLEERGAARLALLEQVAQTVGATIYNEDGSVNTEKRDFVADIIAQQMAKDPREREIRNMLDSRFGTTYPRGSKLADMEAALTDEQRAVRDQMTDEITRMIGTRISQQFDILDGDSEHGRGAFVEYRALDGSSVLKVLRFAAATQSGDVHVARHESVHAFFSMLEGRAKQQVYRDLRRAIVESSRVRSEVVNAYKDQQAVLDQLDPRKNPDYEEELMAYAFQLYVDGKLNLNPKSRNFFNKVVAFVANVLGLATQEQRAAALFDALLAGELNPSDSEKGGYGGRNIANKMRELNKRGKPTETFRNKLERTAPGVARMADTLFATPTEVLRNSGSKALSELAEMFAPHMASARNGGLIANRGQRAAQFHNRWSRLVGKFEKTEISQALADAQAMREPTTAAGREVRAFLADMYQYSNEAGVKRWDPKLREYKNIVEMQNYFPRVWEHGYISQHEDEFKTLIKKYSKMSDDEIDALLREIAENDGRIEILTEKAGLDAGFTPFQASISKRGFTFIDESNAHEFAKFQSQDMNDIMAGYIEQAVHRAEYTRLFGNRGEVIDRLIKRASVEDGISPEEIIRTYRYHIDALSGTLGSHSMGRGLRLAQAAAITAQNILLLPFAIFSQVIDGLGSSVRTGNIRDAKNAYGQVLKDMARFAFRDKSYDYAQDVAEMLGVVSQEAAVQAVNNAGMFMMNKGLRNVNRHFFRWNGMSGWNDSMRKAAMITGIQFLEQHTGLKGGKVDERRFEELGLTLEEAKDMVVRFREGERRGVAPEFSTTQAQAMYRFVDQAVIRPNASMRASWLSDPRWMIFAHLKQFTYGMHKVTIARALHEADNDQAASLAILAGYAPMALAADMTKWALLGMNVTEDWGPWDYMRHAVSRGGLLGLWEFGTNVAGDAGSGRIPGSSLVGPTVEHGITVARSLNVGVDKPVDWDMIADRSLPGYKYISP